LGKKNTKQYIIKMKNKNQKVTATAVKTATIKKVSPAQMRKVIAKNRKRGDSGLVATKMKNAYSQTHICNVLSGVRNNTAILTAAYSLINNR